MDTLSDTRPSRKRAHRGEEVAAASTQGDDDMDEDNDSVGGDDDDSQDWDGDHRGGGGGGGGGSHSDGWRYANMGGVSGGAASSLTALQKVQKTAGRQRNVRKWTAEEDEMLREAVQRNEGKSWKIIALHVPGRDHTQCLQRWSKCLAPGLRKGTWFPDEDEKLTRKVTDWLSLQDDTRQGVKKIPWGEVCKDIEGRTAKQCRERWVNNLNPSINKDPWSPEEDALMVTLHEKYGPSWAAIAKEIPGRTENGVKIRWKSLNRPGNQGGVEPRPRSSTGGRAGSRTQHELSMPQAMMGGGGYVDETVMGGIPPNAYGGWPHPPYFGGAVPNFGPNASGPPPHPQMWTSHDSHQMRTISDNMLQGAQPMAGAMNASQQPRGRGFGGASTSSGGSMPEAWSLPSNQSAMSNPGFGASVASIPLWMGYGGLGGGGGGASPGQQTPRGVGGGGPPSSARNGGGFPQQSQQGNNSGGGDNSTIPLHTAMSTTSFQSLGLSTNGGGGGTGGGGGATDFSTFSRSLLDGQGLASSNRSVMSDGGDSRAWAELSHARFGFTGPPSVSLGLESGSLPSLRSDPSSSLFPMLSQTALSASGSSFHNGGMQLPPNSGIPYYRDPSVNMMAAGTQHHQTARFGMTTSSNNGDTKMSGTYFGGGPYQG